MERNNITVCLEIWEVISQIKEQLDACIFTKTCKLLHTKAPYLNVATGLRLVAITGGPPLYLEHEDKKQFAPKHQFSTASSSRHCHVAIMLHTRSIYDETYGNLILWESEQ